MAYVLVENNGVEKGVLVFKHSEYRFLSSVGDDLIKNLKSNYHIGLYIGFFSVFEYEPEYVDFFIAADNVLEIKKGDKNKPRLPLNGFNFINEDLFNKNEDINKVKKYDFLFVGNSQTRKNLLKLVKAFRKLSEKGVDFSAFIINRFSDDFEQKSYLKRVRDEINKIPHNYRKGIKYLELSYQGDMLPKEMMSQIYQESRSLVCPSLSEGAARVVAEAALNDLVIISYSKMKGGTNNHLDEESDFIFSDLDLLSETLEEFIYKKNKYKFYISKNKKCYSQVESKKRLVDFLFDNGFCKERRKLEAILKSDLYNAFSGHKNILHESMSNSISDEVLSHKKMLFFVSSKLEKRVDWGRLSISFFKDFMAFFRKPIVFIKGLVKAMVR
ncbi:glycosyltransferase [Marinomonas ostreistagni]|uniref:glycosyltransferase n=1 Tax=Marinomonas ostreistagni TaxID=359209 RepID=UPI00194E4359|nr:glycosyltransferase [Marinomonas ostreistagni]MBM6551062.1 glycosyltransferase [Marinomonas ostreistagni]